MIDLPNQVDSTTLTTIIDQSFSIVHPRRRVQKKATVAAEAVWKLYDGRCQSKLKDWSAEAIREENPYRKAEEIAKVMDLSAGQLNLSGYSELRKGLEIRNKRGKIPKGKGWLCPEYYVKCAQYAIEREARKAIPYEMLPLADIDGFQFNYEKAMCYLTDKVYKLAAAAKDSSQPRVMWAYTVDGVRVSRNVTLVIAGLKCIDPRATDPETGQYITLVQSPSLCFPLKVLVTPDNKTTYNDRLADFFAFFKSVNNTQIGDYPPGTFEMVSPQDGSSIWKALARGGACKVKKDFCPYCSCTSRQCVTPRAFPCNSCVLQGRTACFHWDVGDAATYRQLQLGLEQLKMTYPFLAATNDVMSKIRMRYEPCEVEKDITNIEFNPTSTEDNNQFSTFINADLKVLGMSRIGSLSQRQSRLLDALKASYKFNEFNAGQDAAKYPGAMIYVRQAIPCILHLENRCGEKILKTLLVEVIQQSNKTNKEEDDIIKQIELVANTTILGNPWQPSNWRIQLGKGDKGKRVIQDMTMPNVHVRKFMNLFHELTAVCFDTTNEEEKARKEEWDVCRDLWVIVVEIARKKEDFSDAEIDTFQTHCDTFSEAWLHLHRGGDGGMTNYFHIVAAGHLSYYLREWRNLYRFSQQGWEGMNSVIKSVLHKRSQKGGNGGKKGQRNSKVEPVARWALRRMFFLSGEYKTKVEYKK
jgi:hypothetical protein